MLLFQRLALLSCFGWKRLSAPAPVRVVLMHQDMADTHCIQQVVQNRFQRKSETKQTSYVYNTNKGTPDKSVIAGSSHLKFFLVTAFSLGGCCIKYMRIRYAFKANYVIINNMIPNKVDRRIV